MYAHCLIEDPQIILTVCLPMFLLPSSALLSRTVLQGIIFHQRVSQKTEREIEKRDKIEMAVQNRSKVAMVIL